MRLRATLISCAIILLSLQAYSQTFVDVGEDQGLFVNSNESFFGSGVSFFDFDHDGWDDLTFGQDLDSILFFKNVNGIFEQVYFDIPPQFSCKSVLWVDFDNDGDSDLMTSNQTHGNKLYRNNGDMTFEDISAWCGLFQDPTGTHQSWAANWGDYDNDGYLDVYIVNNHDPVNSFIVKNYLYHNNGGNGTFTDVTESAGLFLGNDASFQGAFIDYNLDGLLDLYLINDKITMPNRMYENNGDGTFTDVTDECGAGVYIDAMSNTYGDVELDGDQDLYLTNTDAGNVLLMHDGVDYYSDETFLYNVEVNLGCFAANFVDFDNDMYEDLYVSTTTEFGAPFNPQNYALRNVDGIVFFEVNDIFADNDHMEYTNAMGDFNNDGRADIVGFNHFDGEYSKLWMNTTQNTNRYMKVSLEGRVTNRDGVSSWIKMYHNGIQQTRFTFLGEDYLAQDSQREIFGMGLHSVADSLIIEWQSGHVDKYYNLLANNTYHFIEGASIAPEVEYSNFCIGDSTVVSAAGDFSSYEWNTGDTTEFIVVSEPGTYSVIGFTDLGVPSSPTYFTIEAQAFPEMTSEVINVSCFEGNNGSIQLDNLLGTEISEVSWSNDSTGVYISGLSAGTYSYEAIDIYGCGTQGEVEILQPDALFATADVTNVQCFDGCDGLVEFEITGGNGGYLIDSETSELCAGHFFTTITDSTGCEFEIDYYITEPEELVISVETTDITDEENGTAIVSIEGGTEPYTIEWSNGSDEESTNDLNEDSYWVEVTDNNGCSSYLEFDIVVGIEESKLQSISLFPNPAKDVLNFSGLPLEPCDYRIFDAEMKLVQTGKLEQDQILVDKLSSGNYFLELDCMDSDIIRFTKN